MKRPKNIVVKQSIIPELVSGSSTQSVTKLQALKTLKKFQELSYCTTARGFTRGRHPELVSGSSRSIKGFTLIELLVVVLIIGILAAVAVPQYQKAVMKSRVATLKPAAKAIKDVQEVFYFSNGEYATQTADLDIQDPKDIMIDLNNANGHSYVTASRADLDVRYTYYLNHSEEFASNVYCEALSSNELAKDVCVSEGGQTAGAYHGYNRYLVAGSSSGEYQFEATGEEKNIATGYGYTNIYSNGSDTITIHNVGPTVSVTTCNAENICTSKTYSAINNGRPDLYPNALPWEDFCEAYPFVSKTASQCP